MTAITEFARRSRYMRHLARERYWFAERWQLGDTLVIRPARWRHMKKLRRYSEIVKLGSVRRDG